MSILDDFRATESIQLDPVDLDVVEPPRFGLTPVPGAPSGLLRRVVPCISKERGSLDATLALPFLGRAVTIAFEGTFLGVDSRGRWLVRWRVAERMPPRLPDPLERIQGQITIAIAPLEPFRTDLMDCAGAAGEFFVSLSLVALDDLDEGFRRLPSGEPAVNELRIWATGVTPTRALITGVRGDAGVAAPPPTPWPQPLWMTLSTYCVASARSTRSVFGEVRLDRPVLRSHTGFMPDVTAEGLEPPRSLEVRRREPIGPSVFFEILLPPDLSGPVRVTAITSDRSRIVGAQFHVGGLVGFGCGPIEDPGPVTGPYEPIPVGCEAWDCGWTALNDLTELIGRSGGLPVRYLTTRRTIDPVGRLVGDQAVLRAINNHGRVVGVIDHGDGKVDSFVYGEPGSDGAAAPELYRVAGVSLQALNDAGTAVGARIEGDRIVPVRWAKGQLEDVKVPSANAIALAVDGAENIAGLHVPEGSGPIRGFVMDEQGFRDLGDLGGNVVSLAMNGAGAVAGTVISEQAIRGFVHSPQSGLFDLKLPIGSSHSAVSGIDDAGTVVGTFWSDKDSFGRGFRFTMEHGVEDLNTLVTPDRSVVVEEVVAVNNLGQILTLGSEKGERGYFVLHPASIPTPQVPIP